MLSPLKTGRFGVWELACQLKPASREWESPSFAKTTDGSFRFRYTGESWCGRGSVHLPCSRISAISRASASACGRLYWTQFLPT